MVYYVILNLVNNSYYSGTHWEDSILAAYKHENKKDAELEAIALAKLKNTIVTVIKIYE